MDSLMQLRVYSSSDSGSDTDVEEDCKNDKREGRLPVPDFGNAILVKNVSTNETNCDGKVRNFPHEPGNWATYIYLPVDTFSEFFKYVENLKCFMKPLNLKTNDDFHISLSRTVVLKHHWIQSFVESVKNNTSNIQCFKIHLSGLKTYSNEQKTRTFLSLKVNEGEENLRIIVNYLDNCLQEYNLPCYYQDPSFHLSLLWCAGDKVMEINEFIKRLPLKLANFDLFLEISHCVCTSGNKNFKFNFCS